MFPPIDEAQLFAQLPDREAGQLGQIARQRRLAALARLGHTQYEVQILVDAHEPYSFLFTRPPTLLDVAGLMTEFNLHEHIVSIRVQTKKFADLKLPRFMTEQEPALILSQDSRVVEAAE